MLIVWDEPKRAANLDKHGFDFASFEHEFNFAGAVEVAVKPSRTGRVRFGLVGQFGDGNVVVAILSPLGAEAVSLVSLRRASNREKLFYGF